MGFKAAFALLCCFFPVFSQPIKVLFLTTSFPQSSQTPLFNQAASLIDQGVDLHFFSMVERRNPVIHDVILKYDLMSKVSYRTLPDDLNTYDIIHVQFAGMLHKYMKQLAAFPGKIVCSSRGDDTTHELPKYPAEVALINKMVHLFLPVCGDLKEKLIELGIDKRKIKVLHSTINMNNFPYRKPTFPADGKIKILSVCRLVEKKGLDDALKAIALIKKVYPQIVYTIIGDGENKGNLVDLAHALNIEDVVVFAGVKTQAEVSQALAEGDLFLLPSKKTNNTAEGIPNAIKEAMAVGLPVVSTNHAGIPELITNEVSGLLVPEGKPHLIAKKIVYLIKHAEIWESLSKNGRTVIENEYDMDVVNRQLYRYYLNLLGRQS